MTALFFLGLLAALIAGHQAPPAPSDAGQSQAGVLEHAQEAIHYRRMEPFADSVFHVVRVDLRAPEIALALTPTSERGRAIEGFSGHASSLVAINASFFSKQFAPVGLSVSQGEPWPDAYALDNAVFACDAQKRCRVISQPPTAAPAEWHLAVGGIPALLEQGVDVSEAVCAKRRAFCNSPHPRTAVGLGDEGQTLWIVTAEGRRDPVQGVNIAQLIEVFRQLGATEAINLDGGGSSSLSLKGEQRMARPFNETPLRRIANALLVMPAANAMAPSRHP